MSNNIKLPKRDVCYQNESFIIKKFDYEAQYFPFYKSRLASMKKRLMVAAKQQWPYIPIYSLCDLAGSIEVDKSSQEDEDPTEQENPLSGKDIIIMGVLMKKMPRQPNILKEINHERRILHPSLATELIGPNENFCSPDDTLFLQEDSEGIELKGIDAKPDRFCTGVCLAVKGQINTNGSGFNVEDVCFASPPETTTEKIERPSLSNDYYVLIVSGLNFTNDLVLNEKMTNSLNILYDIVSGNSEIVLNQTIVNLIIAGNSICASAHESVNDRPWIKKKDPNSCRAIQMLDQFLANVGQKMFVDIMPGHTDSATVMWPQQPLHPCLLPKASRFTSIHSVTNPHRARYYGVDFLGTSGENIDSIRRSTSYTDTLEIMRNVLQWGHISPGCPDILHSYPFKDQPDPFVIDEYPDIFFVGNQSDFGIGSFISSDSSKTVRLISVPAFDDKFIGVMVNLRTLACEMLALN